MDQMSMMAEIERAEIVVTFKYLGQGEVEGSTYAPPGFKKRDVAKILRHYADIVEAQENEDD